MDPVILQKIFQITAIAVPTILAITMHEAAHGYVAWRLGDDTALRLGRVTFNPLRHIDLYGTIILPGILLLLNAPFLFGYAKPVPVNFGRLFSPRRDMVWVALAGPGTNLLLAIGSALLIHLAGLAPEGMQKWFVQTMLFSIEINLILAIFNMIPLPPLDGGRVAVGLLPNFLALPLARLERYGFLILIAAMILLPWAGSGLGLDLNPIRWLIEPPYRFLYDLVLSLTGHL